MKTLKSRTTEITPSDVAKYFLYRSMQDGELVSPLKMQKLVYYAYSWNLVKNGEKLFQEPIEAWPNGPVVPSLYRQLKKYGSAPIGEDFLGTSTQEEVDALMGKFKGNVGTTIDMVYQEYMTKTAFELVMSTHSEKPWIEARKGLSATERSNSPITDEMIVQQYGQA